MPPERLLPYLLPVWRLIPEPAQWRIMWLLNPKYAVGVTGIVFDADGNVLLLEHTFRRRFPWGLVSGWIKRDESLVAALHREVAEETGLTISIDELFQVRTDRLHFMVEVVYLCHLEGGTFRPSSEVTAAQWRDPSDLPAGVHPHHFPLIRAAARARRLHIAARTLRRVRLS